MSERPQTAPRSTDPRPTDPRRGASRTAEHRPADTPPTDTPPADTPPADTPPTDTPPSDTRAASDGGPVTASALFTDHDLETVTRRWHEIQAGFVDAPRQAVKDADALVADLMERLAQAFAAERQQLDSHTGRGDQVSTEDLRLALQRYRSFFQRLLSMR